jgi:lysozyme C
MSKSSPLGAALFAAALSIVSFSAVGCGAAAEPEEDLGESEGHLLAGPRLTPSQVAGYLRQAGFPEAVVGKMVCTAKWESSFYTRASNTNRNGSTDYGLFQINSIHLRDTGCPRSAAALYDPLTNTKCAYAVYKMQGINAWYGYQKHRTECNAARAPASTSAPSSSGAPQDDEEDAGGGCWSATLGDMQNANACVQSASNGIWYQCHDGAWYRGVSGGAGPYGTCSSLHPR